MSIETKTPILSPAKLAELAQQAGILLMTAAVTVGMLELPNHGNNKIVVPNQPALALASENSNQELDNSARREREETAPHYINYSVTQRTPGRTGER